MAQPFVGEIRMFAGSFAPAGWMLCDGQLLPIAENEVLFQLIGTTYGGDGESTFALPNLQSRVPIHQGNGFIVGETGGVEEVTLTVPQIPAHNHPLLCNSGAATDPNPQNDVMAEQLAVSAYQNQAASAAMAPQSIGAVGGSQPHSNIQPYLCINYIISLFGLFPPPS